MKKIYSKSKNVFYNVTPTKNFTPYEKHGRVWLKRDDYFKPFKDFPITGGKVRQCINLIESHLEYIKEECDGTVGTASSVHSPQSVIVSRVAKHFNLKSFIGVGNTSLDTCLRTHKTLRIASELGSEIIVLCETQAFSNVLNSRMRKLREERKFMEIDFGFQAKTHRDAILDSNARQVENMPENITTLVVPVGSAVSFCGILKGILDTGRDVRVVALQPFGYDRRPYINTIVDCSPLYGNMYDYYMGEYDYRKAMVYDCGNVELDTIYESKAYHMLINSKKDIVDWDKEEVCYWIVGNANWLREK